MEDYDIITRIGGGSFADVYKASEKSTGEIVAIKVLKKKYSNWEECLELRECKSLKKLHEEHLSNQPGNENIVKLKRIIFVNESGTLNLIFEYLEKDLYELMKGQSPLKLTETQIRSITYQTLLGLSYMHKYGFFHRDMKPENLLVIGDKVKIADFGLAREIRSVPPYTEYVSTRYYRAPECILKSTNYNSPVDIWALGAIIAEMYLHPQPLFLGSNEKEVLFKICSVLGTPTHSNWSEGLQQAKKENIRLPNVQATNLAVIIPQASSDAIDLMYQMLHWNPKKRATAYNLLQHPFFTRCGSIMNGIYLGDGSVVKNNSNSNNNNNGKNSSDITKYSANAKAVNESSRNNKKVTESYDESASGKDEDTLSKMLNDTEGFDKLINKLKNDKLQEDKEMMVKDVNINLLSRDFDLNDIETPKYRRFNNDKHVFAVGLERENEVQQNALQKEDNFDIIKGKSVLSGFNTNVRLKKDIVKSNNRKNSARRIIEENINKVEKNGGDTKTINNQQGFVFENDNVDVVKPQQMPVIVKSDYSSRRNYNRDRGGLTKLLEENEQNMMIGETTFDKRKIEDTNNTISFNVGSSGLHKNNDVGGGNNRLTNINDNNNSNSNNNNNAFLFKFESRRGGNFKNWAI